MNPALNYSMFAASKQQTTDNASFAFGKPLGSEFGLGYTDTTYNSRGLGILAARTMLTVGDTTGGMEAPVNKAGRTLYTKYWEKNSSIANFAPQDITIYTYGSAQCVALLGWLTTIYGVRKIANPNTKYSKNVLWTALGVNARDIVKHLTDLRGYINNKMLDLQNIRLDSSIPLYLYADNMYKHIYMDSPNTSKTQYYVTRPSKVLIYNRTGEGIGTLSYDSTLDTDVLNLTYDELTEFIDRVWTAFFNSAYIAEISAAIGKAGVKTYSYNEVTEAQETKPYFDARALMRFKNATVHPGVSATDITQDVLNQSVSCTISAQPIPNQQVEDMGASRVHAFVTCNQFLHAFSEKTETPEESIVTGSWMYSVELNQGEEFENYILKHFGFEIVTNVIIFGFTADGVSGYTAAPCFNVRAETDLNRLARAASIAKEFDFMPTVRFCSGVEGGSGISAALTATIVEADDYVVLTTNDLYKLHRTGVYAILGVPVEG